MATQVTEHYASIAALGRYCASLKGKSPAREEQSINHSTSQSWCMNTDLNAATDMATSGGLWPEGAHDLQSVDIQDQAHRIAESIAPAIVNDVTGGFLDVPEYLAGESPEVFMRLDDEQDETRPIVRIGVCAVPQAMIKAHELMNRGRAIMALVDGLEMKGYSTELDAMFIAHNGDQTYIASTVIKAAGQPWDASSAAFALAHPAFSRRLGFRALEFNNRYNWMTEFGYGNGRIAAPEGFDLYFPYLDDGDEAATPDKALEYVQRLTKKQKPELGL